jgi:hypothetical protein
MPPPSRTSVHTGWCDRAGDNHALVLQVAPEPETEPRREGEHRAIVALDLAEQSPHASASSGRRKPLDEVPRWTSPLEIIGKGDPELCVAILPR